MSRGEVCGELIHAGLQIPPLNRPLDPLSSLHAPSHREVPVLCVDSGSTSKESQTGKRWGEAVKVDDIHLMKHTHSVDDSPETQVMTRSEPEINNASPGVTCRLYE